MTSLPLSLVRFELELEQAIRREAAVRGSRRPRRRLLRLLAVPAVAAAVVVSVLSTLPGNGQSVVARAAAALSGSGDSIVHVVMAGRDVNADGTAASWSEESWQETRAPFAHRTIRIARGARVEVSTPGNGTTEIYDQATNTIYRGTTPLPDPKIVPSDRKLGAVASKKAVAAGIEAKKEIAKEVDSIRAKVLGILESGKVADAGRTTVNGRIAVRLDAADGSVTILVDPRTYQPILWTTRSPDGSTTTVHFDAYEKLARTAAAESLFSLPAQHPTARLDDSQSDYEAAAARLLRKH